MEIKLNIDDLNQEVSESCTDRLSFISKWLYDVPLSPKTEVRLSPSLIVRGEAELFGISMPRFAARVLFSADSFINLRRLAVFEKVLIRAMGTQDQHAIAEMRTLFLKSSFLADGVLQPPSRFSGFKVLAAELGMSHGERKQIWGVPFVTHVELFGGGLCAQAACFMVTMLWQHLTRGMFGVAEITELAEIPEAEFINLGGMTSPKMLRYFKHEAVGLNAAVLQPEQLPGKDTERKATKLFGESLRSYVASGIPIVLPVDVGRMNGLDCPHSIFEQNNLPDWIRQRWSKSGRSRPHAVIVVGVDDSPQKSDSSRQFLLNDPASFPFLAATAEQLSMCRPYEAGIPQGSALSLHQYIPVTPADVRLPLDDMEDLESPNTGLRGIARALQIDARDANLPLFDDIEGYKPGEFRLLDLESYQIGRNGCVDVVTIPDLPSDFPDFMLSEIKENALPTKWCWVQSKKHPVPGGVATAVEHSVWVWDATLPPASTVDTVASLWKYLIQVYVRKGGKWSVRHRSSLRPSLITSFQVESQIDLQEFWKQLPQDSENQQIFREQYLLMQRDADVLLSGNAALAGANAVELMAASADDAAAIDRICDSLIYQNSPICAVATFIPEIAFEEGSGSGKLAQRAIKFIAQVALRLCELGQPVSSIELVGGSKIGGVGKMTMIGSLEGSYLARRLPLSEIFRRCFENLRRGLGSEVIRRLKQSQVPFAFELEPGPLFALSSLESLVEFCDFVDNGPQDLSSIIGLNLDIAHWRLSGISPADVQSSPSVRRRIVHAHISGHHRSGHLGDLHLNDFDGLSMFRPWLQLLRQLHAEPRDAFLPRYSGYISHEFECAKSQADVIDSVSQLHLLCKG